MLIIVKIITAISVKLKVILLFFCKFNSLNKENNNYKNNSFKNKNNYKNYNNIKNKNNYKNYNNIKFNLIRNNNYYHSSNINEDNYNDDISDNSYEYDEDNDFKDELL